MCNPEMITVELKYKGQSKSEIIGTDHTGVDRYFKPNVLDCKVENGKLFVVISAKEWNKRLNKQNITKPKVLVKLKERKCLMCQTVKMMERHNHICDDCKESHAWHEGHSYLGEYV